MQESLKNLKSELKSVSQENAKMRELLSALVEHNNVSLAGEDEF